MLKMIITISFFVFILMPFYSSASEINLPSSGQTLCYDDATTIITVPCEGTGQNGAIQAGQPFPSPRFTAANGTVTDNLTGLIWLREASCTDTLGGITPDPYLSWTKALTWSNKLASGYCGLTDGSTVGQWRLPTRLELESLVDASKFGFALPTGHSLLHLQDGDYWSSSTYSSNTNYAWTLDTRSGFFITHDKSNLYYFVLPVRGGQ